MILTDIPNTLLKVSTRELSVEKIRFGKQIGIGKADTKGRSSHNLEKGGSRRTYLLVSIVSCRVARLNSLALGLLDLA